MPASIDGGSNNPFRIGFGQQTLPQALEKLTDYLQIFPKSSGQSS